MRAKDVIVGRCYLMKVGGQVVPCRLMRVFEQPRGPWTVGSAKPRTRTVFELRNLRTGRTARAYSATKLRREATPAEIEKAEFSNLPPGVRVRRTEPAGQIHQTPDGRFTVTHPVEVQNPRMMYHAEQ